MWLRLPTSISSPASADSDLDLKSLSRRLAVCVTWRSNFMPPKFWLRVLPSLLLRTQLNGLTLSPSTVDAGMDLWMRSLAASHARTSRSQGDAPESVESALDSSTSTSVSSKKSRLRSSSSKTLADYSQVSLFSTDPKYWDTTMKFAPPRKILRKGVGTLNVTLSAFTGDFSRFTESPHCCMSNAAWERWVTEARLDCSRRQKRAQAMRGSDVSSWPTSRAEDSESCGNHPGATDSLTGATRNWLTPHGMNGKDHAGKEGRGGEFAKQAKNWTTPQAHDVAPGNPDRVRRYGTQHGAANLTDDVTLWMTPNVPNGSRSVSEEVVNAKGSTPEGKRQVGLESQTRFWSTPTSAMTTGEGREGREGRDNLQTQVGSWGTPTSRDWKDGGSANTAPTNGLLGRQVIQNWPSPTKTDSDRGTGTIRPHDTGIPLNQRVAQITENWPTPDANAINDGESRESWQKRAGKLKLQHKNGNGAGMPLAIACQSSPLDQPQPGSGATCWCQTLNCDQLSHKRRLNSLFTVWMMGWPLHWLAPEQTSYGRAATELFLYRLRSRLLCLLEGLE